jgi:hypothetical protein
LPGVLARAAETLAQACVCILEIRPTFGVLAKLVHRQVDRRLDVPGR